MSINVKVPAAALSLSVLIGCGGLDTADPTLDVPRDTAQLETPLAPVDADAVRPTLPPVDLSLNRRPCGDSTIAVVDDELGGTYAFCAFGDDGITLLEMLPAEGIESRLSEDSSALALFERVLPENVVAPSWVRRALRDARPDAAHGTFQHERPVAFAYTGSCSDPQGFFDYTYNSAWPIIYRTVANFGGHGSNYTLRDCVDENAFLHESVTWVQRTASAYSPTTGGACVGAFEVRSCGGYTLMEFWNKSSPSSGSWAVVASAWIASGSRGHLRWYSNSQHSCHPSRDRDDFRVTMNSHPGANGHFAATFVNRARDLGTHNGTCEIDPR